MLNEESRAHSLARTIRELCERPSVPLSVEAQRRRYRWRRRWPDWVWGIVVGLLVSAAVVAAMLLAQK